MPLLLITRSLNYGGAERQLVVLATGLHLRNHKVTVVVFYANGLLQKELEQAGVPVISLDKKGRWDTLGFLWRLYQTVRQQKPKVIYSFLYTPNIISLCFKPLFKKIKIVWGVRASNMDLTRYDWFTGFTYKIECHLSRFADLIIANSHAGKDYAVKNGFPKEKIVVISNGIDTKYFKPNLKERARMRSKWKIQDDEILIGLVGRLDPMKDHPTFLKAASLLAKKQNNLKFICIGDGSTEYREELYNLGQKLLNEKVIWTGKQSKMSAIYNALDISSSSYGEGFPNVIGESMACGIPCVVTDVGDSALIVGKTGKVVPPKNPKKLADALSSLILELKRPHYSKGKEAQQRIIKNFSVKNMLDLTEQQLWNMD